MPSSPHDAGVPLRDVQEAAGYADNRTTMRYDRARVSLDRHATHIVAAYIAGAAGNRTCPRITAWQPAKPPGGPAPRPGHAP